MAKVEFEARKTIRDKLLKVRLPSGDSPKIFDETVVLITSNTKRNLEA